MILRNGKPNKDGERVQRTQSRIGRRKDSGMDVSGVEETTRRGKTQKKERSGGRNNEKGRDVENVKFSTNESGDGNGGQYKNFDNNGRRSKFKSDSGTAETLPGTQGRPNDRRGTGEIRGRNDGVYQREIRVKGEREARSTESRLKLSTNERVNMYPNFGKGAMILKDAKTENINDGISKVTKGKSGSGFVEDLHRDFRRRMEEISGNSNSRLDQNDVSYSLATDGIPDFDDLWDIAIKKYGTIPAGEKPAREIQVPKKIADDKPVSRFARTMMEAGVTPEFAISEFEKGVLDGTLTHEVITNKTASDYAEKRIKELGFEGALNRWTELAAESKVGKKQFALGIELYNQCVNNRDVKNAMKIVAELASEATRAGEVLQACRMLKQMNPDGQLYYLEKSIEKINDEFRERLGGKYKDIEIDEKLFEEYLIADNDEARNSVYDRICQYLELSLSPTLIVNTSLHTTCINT